MEFSFASGVFIFVAGLLAMGLLGMALFYIRGFNDGGRKVSGPSPDGSNVITVSFYRGFLLKRKEGGYWVERILGNEYFDVPGYNDAKAVVDEFCRLREEGSDAEGWLEPMVIRDGFMIVDRNGDGDSERFEVRSVLGSASFLVTSMADAQRLIDEYRRLEREKVAADRERVSAGLALAQAEVDAIAEKFKDKKPVFRDSDLAGRQSGAPAGAGGGRQTGAACGAVLTFREYSALTPEQQEKYYQSLGYKSPVDTTAATGGDDAAAGLALVPASITITERFEQEMGTVSRDGMELSVPVFGGDMETYPAPFGQPPESTVRDWTEDMPHENGNYQCRCVHCKEIFIGHKRRVCCKLCATAEVAEGSSK